MTYLKLFLTLFLLHLTTTEGFCSLQERVCPDPDTQPGQCTPGKECPGTPTSTTLKDCFDELQTADATCLHFDFNTDGNKCVFHKECVADTTIATSVYGPRECTPVPDPGLKCGDVGTWMGCTTQTAAPSPNYADCLQQCADATPAKCTHFTFFPGTFSRDGVMERKAACFKYTGCTELDPKGCTNCISGQAECGDLECGIDRCCQGDPVGSLFGVTAEQCLDYCNANTTCKWYSYYKELEGCILTGAEDCISDGQPTGTCNSGQKGCPSIGTPTCYEDSCCADSIQDDSLVTSEEACLKRCSITPGCKWYTFVKDIRFCLLFSGICREKIDVGAGLCSSGEPRCPTGTKFPSHR